VSEDETSQAGAGKQYLKTTIDLIRVFLLIVDALLVSLSITSA